MIAQVSRSANLIVGVVCLLPDSSGCPPKKVNSMDEAGQLTAKRARVQIDRRLPEAGWSVPSQT